MALRLTDRDLAILKAVHAARYMVAPQIQALFWRESRGGEYGQLKACQRRLRQLHRAGLLRRIEQPVKRGEGPKPFIYALDRRGAQLLAGEFDVADDTIQWKPVSREENYPFLGHLLATTDFRISLLLACERNDAGLENWMEERELKAYGLVDHVMITSQDGVRKIRTAVVPDAAFVLQRQYPNGNDVQTQLLLEIDRGTVTVAPGRWEQRGWRIKIQAYLAYHAGGAYTQRYGVKQMRVLTVTTGERRLVHLKDTTEKVGGDRRFWFTTFEQALNSELLLTAPIWQCAGLTGEYPLLP